MESLSAVKDFLLVLRPKQWTKNLLVFAGLVFSGDLFVPFLLARAFRAFLVFSVLSATVYLVNDLIDRERDRLHPIKRNRPIAAGRISPGAAAVAAIMLGAGAVAAALRLDGRFGQIAIGYLALMISYSVWLKHLVIIDAAAIAAGFVLRAAAGAVVVGVDISPWLLVCTFLLAMFLALSKRRHELSLLTVGASDHRRALDEYSARLLDQMISVMTSSTLMAYALYTFSGVQDRRMVYTIPFVLYGIFRYLYLVHNRDLGGSPETILLSDPPTIINLVLWSAAVIYIIYF